MSKAPKLRFKEFSGDWKEDELGNIIEISKSKYNPLKNEEDYKCIELENLSQETGQLLGYFNSKEQQSIKNKFNKGEVLFGKLRPYLKKYWLADFEGVCSSEIWVLNGIKASNNFVYRLVQTDKFNFISNISSGSKMPRADWSYMREFPFFIPTLEEQDKIASFFSLIDDKISLQREKVEALKDYKRGMMQKIFSRELRFKDDEGRDYPEWEAKKLKHILKEVSEKSKENNQHEVISSTTNGLFLQKEYFNREIASSDNTGYKILRRNQVVLSPQNLWMGNINFNDKYDIGIVSPSYKIFDINDKFDNKYIGYILRTPRAFYEFMQSSEQGASIVRRNLNMDLFNEITFDMPCKEEQIKIAKFIGSIDLKIEREQEKLEYLNEYKKGLLQQMFV